eukprot:GDKJ01049170.1.p1 GENE.GDKJ01049170.1~~GDKJ01049170.1.p1  ORF type:complete len:183 (+),score=46.10 GDKJ01049170.1:25-573(+)
MFRKFGPGNVSSSNIMKSSAQRNVRQQIIEDYPRISEVIDEILPKKAQLYLAKCSEGVSVVCINGEALFFQQKDGPWIPTLRLLHKYPSLMPRMRVDAGGFKFVMKGANVMCPGLTSAGGQMEEVEEGEIVQILLEGCGMEAAAIGCMIMSTQQIKEINKDVCIEQIHTMGDGLWQNPNIFG